MMPVVCVSWSKLQDVYRVTNWPTWREWNLEDSDEAVPREVLEAQGCVLAEVSLREKERYLRAAREFDKLQDELCQIMGGAK